MSCGIGKLHSVSLGLPDFCEDGRMAGLDKPHSTRAVSRFNNVLLVKREEGTGAVALKIPLLVQKDRKTVCA